MTRCDSDPYAVPESPRSADFPPEPSVLRGAVFALPFGIAGFVLMYVSISVSTLYREGVFQNPQRLAYASDGIQELCFWPSITCSLIFALAAILKFTPTAHIGIFRALIYTSCYAIIGFLTMIVATIAFDLFPQGYTYDPWKWARKAITIGVLTSLIAVHTAKRCRRSRLDPQQKVAEQVAEPELPITGS